MPRTVPYSLEKFLTDIEGTIERLQQEETNQVFVLGQKDQKTIGKISDRIDSKKGKNTIINQSQTIFTAIWDQLHPNSYAICAIAGENSRVGDIKDKDYIAKVKTLFQNSPSFNSCKWTIGEICFSKKIFPLQVPSTYAKTIGEL
jgi:hypothetical protein